MTLKRRTIGLGVVVALAAGSSCANAAVFRTLGFEGLPDGTVTSPGAGSEVGFSSSSINTGAATFGANDVPPEVLSIAKGSTNFMAANVGKTDNSYFGFAPHISSGALTNRIDTLQLNPVTFTPGSVNRTVSFNMFITGGTTYETTADANNTQDFIKVIADINGTPVTLLDSTTLGNSGDIDTATVAANGYAPDGVYHTLTFSIPANAGTVTISASGAANSSGGAEGFAFDNFQFSQDVPEPAAIGFVGVIGAGLLARRRR